MVANENIISPPMILEIAKEIGPLPGTIHWSESKGLYTTERGVSVKLKLNYHDLGRYGLKTDDLTHLNYLVNEWNYHEFIGGVGGVADVLSDIARNKNLDSDLEHFFEDEPKIKNRLEEIYRDYLTRGWIHENNKLFLECKLDDFAKIVFESYADTKIKPDF